MAYFTSDGAVNVRQLQLVNLLAPGRWPDEIWEFDWIELLRHSTSTTAGKALVVAGQDFEFTFRDGRPIAMTGTIQSIGYRWNDPNSYEYSWSVGGLRQDLRLLTGTGTFDAADQLRIASVLFRSDDRMSGSHEDDVLHGFAGNDLVQGQGGNDVLSGGSGRDTLHGGLGSDTFYVELLANGRYADLVQEDRIRDSTVDRLVLAGSYSGTRLEVALVPNVEVLDARRTGLALLDLSGNREANLLLGNAAANRCRGGDGADTLNGAGGIDTCIGGAGGDTYVVPLNPDGSWQDRVIESVQPGAADTVQVEGRWAGTVPAELWLPRHVENLDASAAGSSSLVLHGSAGANRLTGSSGANALHGGAGADTLTGGGGADLFVYARLGDLGTRAASTDLITDFRRSQGDRVDLRQLDADASTIGDQSFVFIGTAPFQFDATGQLRYEAAGSTLVVYGSIDADPDAEFVIRIAGTATLRGEDFAL